MSPYPKVEQRINCIVHFHLQENIVAFYGSFIKNLKPNQTMWIVMEYCGGGSVSDIYSRTYPSRFQYLARGPGPTLTRPLYTRAAE